MRVAAVIQAYPPVVGGAQRQLERLAPLLAARGVTLDVVTRRPPGTPRRERAAGATIHRVSPFAASPATATSAAFVAAGTARVVRLRPDVIHAFDLLSPSLVGVAASTATGAPLVVKVLSVGRGGDLDRLLAKPFGRRRLRLLARRAAALVCLTREIEDELAAAGIPRDRMHRIANGVDAEHFRPPAAGEREAARAALGVPSAAPLALYCGRFADVKRLDVLVRALREAPHRLVLVGEGPAAESLRGVAREAGVGDRVQLLAPVADTAPLYRAADVYVSASHSEGMSGSVLEAMASGLPIVAAPASGMAELLGDGRGLLVSDDGDAGFARALRAADPSLGSAARRHVAERYSLAAAADALAALYRDLASSS